MNSIIAPNRMLNIEECRNVLELERDVFESGHTMSEGSLRELRRTLQQYLREIEQAEPHPTVKARGSLPKWAAYRARVRRSIKTTMDLCTKYLNEPVKPYKVDAGREEFRARKHEAFLLGVRMSELDFMRAHGLRRS